MPGGLDLVIVPGLAFKRVRSRQLSHHRSMASSTTMHRVAAGSGAARATTTHTSAAASRIFPKVIRAHTTACIASLYPGVTPPYTMGLAFSVQELEDVPVEEHDVMLDEVVFPSWW